MEKKNLLFVIPSLAAGGGEKSLINLLTQIDFTLFNVDLFLFNQEGIFMEFLPKQVRVLDQPEAYRLFTLPLYHSIMEFLFQGNIALALNRVLFSMKNRKLKEVSIREQYSWKYMAKSLDMLEKKYDAAIGFLEKTSTYFCVDKVKASKKIGWVHIDYDKLGMDPAFDIHYFQQLNKIVTVSEECANIFIKRFPTQENKVEVIYNIVSPTIINKMAEQEVQDVYNKKEDETIILTIARLHYQKGLELAVESCKKLLDNGCNIKWFVIGEGEERENLTRKIRENNLEENFKLIGLKSNPYPFIKQADIYVQPSKFEGKSIALDEAKILSKPIVVTNFSTAKDQINHGVDGLIVDMNSDGLANGIEEVIRNQNLRKNLSENLSKLEFGTENEVEKLYRIL